MKKIISVLVTYILMFAFIPHQAMILSRALESELIVYPQYDERIPRCYDYGVTVHQGDQSEKLTVYNRNTSGEQMTLSCLRLFVKAAEICSRKRKMHQSGTRIPIRT